VDSFSLLSFFNNLPFFVGLSAFFPRPSPPLEVFFCLLSAMVSVHELGVAHSWRFAVPPVLFLTSWLLSPSKPLLVPPPPTEFFGPCPLFVLFGQCFRIFGFTVCQILSWIFPDLHRATPAGGTPAPGLWYETRLSHSPLLWLIPLLFPGPSPRT